MDPNRQECLRPVVKTLKGSRRAGMVYLAPDGRKMDSAYAWPWPDPGGERPDVLRLVIEQLEKVRGRWRLCYVEEGTPKTRAYAAVWPEEAGLFEFIPGQEQASWPAWAFEEEESREEPASPPTALSVLKAHVTVEEGEFKIVREPEAEEERLSEACAEDVVRLLRDVDRRLTITEVLDEFSKRGVEWSSSTVSHTLPVMRRSGRVTNRKRPDKKGRGYGLPDWGGGD